MGVRAAGDDDAEAEHKMRPCDDTQGWGEKGETDGLPRGG